ncbi:endonuclease SmrB [Gallibacterium trehalosifermentans]|uniref:Ribosome rescue factor SmrB n=1 Tax=Gallibacterium trehalosifermentans TaxID=516935 RepID=A0ABV6GYK7_9PAST
MMDSQDRNLFQAFVQGIKPLKQDTVTFSTQQKRQRQQAAMKALREKEDTLFYFSDEYEPLLDEDGGRYLRQGDDHYLLKRLRRGDFVPDLFLDLHGLTREQAKQELAALLLACEKENLPCACIMTGYGSFTLKKQIPRWLVQYPKVVAFHHAPKEWGGDAAFLVLIDVEENLQQL